MNLILLVLAGIFVNNYVMSQFLGICPFLGVSKKVDTAAGMGMAVIFVMALAAAAAWLVYNLILVPLHITFLYNIAFILLIASLVQFVEMFLKKSAPALYQALGVFLTNMQKGYNFIESVLNAVGGAAGFALAIILFAGIRERIADNETPKAFDGFPMALITAGLMSIAFLGFSGLIKL